MTRLEQLEEHVRNQATEINHLTDQMDEVLEQIKHIATPFDKRIWELKQKAILDRSRWTDRLSDDTDPAVEMSKSTDDQRALVLVPAEKRMVEQCCKEIEEDLYAAGVNLNAHTKPSETLFKIEQELQEIRNKNTRRAGITRALMQIARLAVWGVASDHTYQPIVNIKGDQSNDQVGTSKETAPASS